MRRIIAFPLIALVMFMLFSAPLAAARRHRQRNVPMYVLPTTESGKSPASDGSKGSPTATDTPKRVNGRIDPTEAPPQKTFASDAERLEHIVKLLRRDEEMIATYKPPVILCKRVPDGSIKIDGKLDDAAWKDAVTVGDFKDTRPPVVDGKPQFKAMKYPTTAKLAWDSKYLYVGFDCPDTDVVGTIKEHDGELWREDAAEVFIDANGDGMTYLEFECSPSGQIYDGALADYRPETDWLDYKHLDVNKSRDTYNIRDSKMAAQVDGTLNNSEDKDKGWTCEMAISWADIARGTLVRSEVPAPGDHWRIGLYRINVKEHGNPELGEYGAWSPTGTWYHNPKMFGHVIFVDPTKDKKP